jgi:hypothetical protein
MTAYADSRPCTCGTHGPGPSGTAEPCGCLRCLTRPHFFCGMVLTDDHLNELTRWVRDRFALHRFTDGWGVAQGLTVGQRPDGPASVVVVRPGYARSCCGDDIVVCEDLTVDVCAGPRSCPCCGTQSGTAGASGESDEPERRAVDLYLVPTAMPVDPTWVRSRCGCGGHDEPEHERVIEGGVLRPVEVTEPLSDPQTAGATRWEAGLDDCRKILDDYAAAFPESANPTAADVRRWLTGWIRRQDPELAPVLGAVHRRLAAEGLNLDDVRRLVVDVVWALRSHYVEQTAGACQPQSGILLARVWTRATADGCAIECIDATPPFRRTFTRPAWPAPPGQVNLAATLGQRWEIAEDHLLELGVWPTDPADVPTGVKAIRDGLAAELVVAKRGTSVQAVMRPDPCDSSARRVAWLEIASEDTVAGPAPAAPAALPTPPAQPTPPAPSPRRRPRRPRSTGAHHRTRPTSPARSTATATC